MRTTDEYTQIADVPALVRIASDPRLRSAVMTEPSNSVWASLSAALLGPPELKVAEVAEIAGVTPGQARRFWQALGFPRVPSEDHVFTRVDADMLRAAAADLEQQTLEIEVLLQMTRATGQALARLANMHVLTITEEIAAVTRAEGLSDHDRADAIAKLGESLVRSNEPFLGYIWRRHLLAAIMQTMAAADRADGQETGIVGFADLVDFTAASQQLADHELARMVDRFEQIAYAQIPDRGGRVVKILGDEIMFSNTNVHAAADTALALAEACAADPVVPEVRVGLALGSMLAWEGDLYGNTVNLASRLVAIALPGTVLLSDDLGRRLQDDQAFKVHEIRETKLKGIGRTKPWVLRRPDTLTKSDPQNRRGRHR